MPKPEASGRPPVAVSKRRTARLVTYVTPAEAKRLRKRLRLGQTISDALREAMLGFDPAARTPAVEALPPPAPPEVASPPPPTTHGGGPSSHHRASPQQQHGAPGVHQAQRRPHIAPPPPADLDGPAPKAELVAAAKKVLATAWEEPIWAKGAQVIAERDPQLVLDVARESRALRHSAREGWFLLKARAGE